MSTFRRSRAPGAPSHLALFSCLICLAALLSPDLPALAAPAAMPRDPTADIPWSAGAASVADVQAAFNHGRAVENGQLGSHLPAMVLPAQATWNAMSDGRRALWLINRERADRGLLPMYGLDPNVSSVSQAYAYYLMSHNQFSHNADGHDPGWRLAQNPVLAACTQGWLENLYALMTTGPGIALPLERAVYAWMYEDGGCCGWGHRHGVLTDMYTNGPAAGKGLLGIGVQGGGPYLGYPLGVVIVMDAINPCPGWAYPPQRHSYVPLLRR